MNRKKTHAFNFPILSLCTVVGKSLGRDILCDGQARGRASIPRHQGRKDRCEEAPGLLIKAAEPQGQQAARANTCDAT